VATTTVRVPTSTHKRLQVLAAEETRSIGEVIEALLDEDEKHRFFAGLAEDFARLQADPEAWADYQAEVARWDSTLRDGHDDERLPPEPTTSFT
jgi:predicted DNA-binding protein